MTPNQLDENLVMRMAEDDETALVELMSRHKQALFHFVYRSLSNEADSAYIVEDTFLRVYLNSHRYIAKAAVKTWMYTIALNRVRDHVRKEKKRRGDVPLFQGDGTARNPGPSLDATDSGEPDPSRQLDSEERLRLVREAVIRLPEKLRFPFVFCVLDGNSQDECAAILKSNRKTVETRIYRARLFLRTELSNLLKKS